MAGILIILVGSISIIIPSSYAVQDLQKIECVDDNININGIDFNQLTQQQQDQIKRLAGINYADTDTLNSNYNDNDYGLYDDGFSTDNNLVNVCININKNEQVIGPTDEEPPEPLTGTLAVSKFVTCDEFEGDGFTSVQQTERDPCLELLNNITASDFGISMTGNEPVDPDTFLASDPPGQNVLLGSGSYTVTETADASVAANVTALEEKLSVDIEGPIPSFEGDCTLSQTNDFVATGIMAEEASQTCEITNNFLWKLENLDLAVVNSADNNVSILLGNGDGTFGGATDFGVGSQPLSVAVGLFNADSNLDLAVANSNDDNVSIILGNGDGTFGGATDFGVGDFPVSVAVGLFNADNNFDLAVANSDLDVSILLGNGDGTFGAKTDFPVTGQPSFVAVGLFNADSNLDLAVANLFGTAGVSILLGNGDGTFGAKTDFGTGFGPRWIAVGLFNADNNLDLAVANQFDNDVSILLGNGDGTFGAKTDFPVGIQPFSIAVGLFNADNNLDLAVANLVDDDVSILLGNGDGTFGAKTDFPVGTDTDPRSIGVGLFDADNNLDLAVADTSGGVSILLGNGDGTFGGFTFLPAGNAPFSIAVGDFNSN